MSLIKLKQIEGLQATLENLTGLQFNEESGNVSTATTNFGSSTDASEATGLTVQKDYTNLEIILNGQTIIPGNAITDRMFFSKDAGATAVQPNENYKTAELYINAFQLGFDVDTNDEIAFNGVYGGAQVGGTSGYDLSQGEVNTGNRWTDGKPIYRQSFELVRSDSNYEYLILNNALSASDYEKITEANYLIYDGPGGGSKIAGQGVFEQSGTNREVSFSIIGNNMQLRMKDFSWGLDDTALVNVYYTKTTD